MYSLLFLDTYDSFTYNLLDIFESLNAYVTVKQTDNFKTCEIEKKNFDACIIGPGPKSPREIPEVIRFIQTFEKSLPILGICLGHQCIAESYGEIVQRGIKPMHGKKSQIFCKKHPLFEGLKSHFIAGRYHSLIVKPLRCDSPLQVIAKTDLDEIMAISHQTYPIYGLQFHPESILTPDGKIILRNFLTLLQKESP